MLLLWGWWWWGGCCLLWISVHDKFNLAFVLRGAIFLTFNKSIIYLNLMLKKTVKLENNQVFSTHNMPNMLFHSKPDIDLIILWKIILSTCQLISAVTGIIWYFVCLSNCKGMEWEMLCIIIFIIFMRYIC